jgi:hypothetical protein
MRAICERKTGAGVFAAGLLLAALTAPAPSQASRCFANGDLVTFEGVAAGAESQRGGWVLHLTRPICVVRNQSGRETSAIRIIGTPPPLGIPLQLTGKLLLGRNDQDTTLFAALSVIRGHKMRETTFVPPPRAASVSPSPSAPRQISSPTPVRRANQRCDAPPYGGTHTDYQAFVSRFGRIISPRKILAGICSAKFGRSGREGLHKLGFSDAKIDSESTERLAGDTIVALKTLVNTIE